MARVETGVHLADLHALAVDAAADAGEDLRAKRTRLVAIAGIVAAVIAGVARRQRDADDVLSPDGIDGDILAVLWPIHNGLLRYTGFDVLPPCVAYMPGREDDATRAGQLEAYRQRLLSLDQTEALFFHPSADYGQDERLKPGIVARTAVQRNV